MSSTNHFMPGDAAVLYVRVSTDEQARTGYSLPDQERKIRKWSEGLGLIIDRVYREDHSAKTFERPVFKQLLLDIRARKGEIKHLLVLRWDRFSRNLEEGLGMIKTLDKLGVRVTAIEQPVDDIGPSALLLQAINLALPEVDNLMRAHNVTAGMIQAMRDGRWPRKAPKGYVNTQSEHGRVKRIEPTEDAPVIKKAFLMILGGSSQEDARQFLEEHGVNCSKSQIQRLLRNPIYAGFIPVPETDGEPAHLVEGLHEAIVPHQNWLAVQEVLDGRHRKREYSRGRDEAYPLRGHLVCSDCNGRLTGSASKGNGGVYPYYHGYKGCNARYRADYVHEAFDGFLDSILIDPATAELHLEVLRDTVHTRERENRHRRDALARNRDEQLELLTKAEDALIRGDIDKAGYARVRTRYEARLRELDGQIHEAGEFEAGFLDHIKMGFDLLVRLKELYHAADVEIKGRILGSIWPEKLAFDGKSFRTIRQNEVIMLLTNNGKGFSRSIKKRAAQIGDSSRLVHPTGFEPVFSA